MFAEPWSIRRQTKDWGPDIDRGVTLGLSSNERPGQWQTWPIRGQLTGDDHGSYLPCSHLSITPCFVHLMVSYGPIVQAFSSSRSRVNYIDWRCWHLARYWVRVAWWWWAVTIITIMCTHHPALSSGLLLVRNSVFSLVKCDNCVGLCNLIIGFTFMFLAGNLQQIWNKFCRKTKT